MQRAVAELIDDVDRNAVVGKGTDNTSVAVSTAERTHANVQVYRHAIQDEVVN